MSAGSVAQQTHHRQQRRQTHTRVVPSLLALVFFAAFLFSDRWRRSLSPSRSPWPVLSLFHQPDPLRLNPSFPRHAPPATRSFDWTITRGYRNPDSVERLVYLVNGVYPGPTIEANVGDTVRVRVRNAVNPDDRLGNEEEHTIYTSKVHKVHPSGMDSNLSLHWHGISVRGAPRADGAVGFSSVPIPVGGEFTYEFKVGSEDAGTHWWHSHLGMSRADGLWGFLVVHNHQEDPILSQALNTGVDAPQAGQPWDKELLFSLGDHFHKPAPVSLGWYLSRFSIGREPVPDNGLINGFNVFDCTRLLYPGIKCATAKGRRSEFHLEPQQTYRLRIVNTGAIGVQTFSIDGHNLTVIEADGTLLEPFTVSHLPVIPGQRYSVLIHTDAASDSDEFWIRSSMDSSCFNMPNPALEHETKAILRYTRQAPSLTGALKWVTGHAFGGADELKRSGPSRGRRRIARHWSRRLPDPKTLRSPAPTNFELDPCRDLPLDLLRPLPASPATGTELEVSLHEPSARPAPDFDEARGDRRVVLYAASPKMDKHGLVPMAVMNRTSWHWTALKPADKEGHQDTDEEEEEVKAEDSLLDRVEPMLWSSDSGNVTEKNLAATWDARHQLVVPIPPRTLPASNSSQQDRTATVEVILHNVDDDPHPFHLHSHKFAVLYRHGPTLSRHTWHAHEPPTPAGWEAAYELARPVWRDTISVPERGFVVLRWKADNPGVWAFHCHTLVHFKAGMAMAFVELSATSEANSAP
ncbi:hypothetical protein OC842_003946 [Tilletia horrida]|uniref:laccase n=1 Tax=Tilletia horrida TaxID=155126 RepID=A0AAN6GF95_9BASI|nr:hypothetical protein OC842_003946 [Tilletia horrida]